MTFPAKTTSRAALVSFVLASVLVAGAAAPPDPQKEAERWVARTLKAMTLDQKVGQLLQPSFQSSYLSSDSEVFDKLAGQATGLHVGGFHVFGASVPAPQVLLNPTYGTVTLGEPLNVASITNRLQQKATIALLNSADYEFGPGMRITGATAFPRAMAVGAAGDERLAFEIGRITAVEARAMGVHVVFAPVADVNNNARNPVINTRSYGEEPNKVAAMASAVVRGIREGGALATLKHFPGHGDTDVDSHLGLPVIKHPRERLDAVELVPFRAAIAAGADAVMIAHIEMPSVDPTPGTPATLSRPVATGLLRGDLGFDGLVVTDSMQMRGVTSAMSAGDAAVRAVKAGNDIVLHSPDDAEAATALKAAITRGEIDIAQVDASVARILRAKARLGLHTAKTVNLDAVPQKVGTREHLAVADEVSRRSITLIKDERNAVPLSVPSTSQVLFLSVLDYPSGWNIAAPSRTFLPELKKRWPSVTAVELSDRTTPSEIELVRALASRYDAVVAAVYVRASSGSGRLDLAAPVTALLRDLARRTAENKTPFVAVSFGNPYVAATLGDLPAMMLTYDFYDRAEASAVRALAGEAAIGGKLPITLPGLFPVGHGLERAARR